MENKVYCWEFWIWNKIDNKINWYIENWSLMLSKSFFPKKIQSSISWKTYTTKGANYIINWKLVSWDLVSLYWIYNWDTNLDIKEYLFSHLIFWNNYNSKEDIKFKYFDFTFDWLFDFLWEWMLEG